ncbi:MAG: ATP-binding cassette domain-containing protein [Culicoidibacterales bacterium]
MLTITDLTFIAANGFRLKLSQTTIPAGQAVALIGANGSGKTTILELLTGILPLKTGKIIINQQNLQTNPLLAKAEFFFVPATLSAFLNFSGMQYWQLLANLYPGDDSLLLSRCESYAQQLELTTTDWQQPLHTCSLGTQKKLLFAAAFACNRPILFCDEPFTGLDFNSRKQLIKLLETFKRNGHTLIFSTHDIQLLETLADTVMLINRGIVAPPQALAQVDFSHMNIRLNSSEVGDHCE